MGRYGHLYCTTCKEEIFLGKWLVDQNDIGTGFWHGQLCPQGVSDAPAPGRKALLFIARHMDHDLLAASDEGGRADLIIESGAYRNVDDEYDDLARAPDNQQAP